MCWSLPAGTALTCAELVPPRWLPVWQQLVLGQDEDCLQQTCLGRGYLVGRSLRIAPGVFARWSVCSCSFGADTRITPVRPCVIPVGPQCCVALFEQQVWPEIPADSHPGSACLPSLRLLSSGGGKARNPAVAILPLGCPGSINWWLLLDGLELQWPRCAACVWVTEEHQ